MRLRLGTDGEAAQVALMMGHIAFSLNEHAVSLDYEQIGALVCWTIAAVLLARVVRVLWRDAWLYRVGVPADGTVVRVIAEYETEKLVIRFSDRRGRDHEFETDLSQAPETYPVGARAAVIYDPARPARAHLAQPGGLLRPDIGRRGDLLLRRRDDVALALLGRNATHGLPSPPARQGA